MLKWASYVIEKTQAWNTTDLKWLQTVSSTSQDLDYNHSLSIDATINHGVKNLPNHW